MYFQAYDLPLNLLTILFFAQFNIENINDTQIRFNKKLVKVQLVKIKSNKKAISSVGFGKSTFSHPENEKKTSYTLTSSTNRWLINKYFADGLFYDLGLIIVGGYSIAPQIKGFADIDIYIIPCISFTIGLGYIVTNSDSYNSVIKGPMSFAYKKIEFSFKKKRIQLYVEINMYFNHERLPNNRVEIAWSKLKRP